MKALAAILAGLATVAVLGCGDDEDEPVRSVTVRAGDPVEIVADEYRFDPGRIVVRSARGDTRLRIVLANRGSLAHNLHLRSGDRELAGMRSFAPGGKRPLEVELAPGEYELFCTVADHEELGMTGELELR